jgi:MtN3 and saliva related transmembrane protein
MEAIWGTIAFATSLIGLIPQIVKSFQTKSTKDISFVMLLNYGVCSLAWIAYGWTTKSLYVIASNVVGLVTSLILVAQKSHYDRA